MTLVSFSTQHNFFNVHPFWSMNQYFIPFLEDWYSIFWIIPYFVHPHNSYWTFGWFSLWGHYESCYYEYSYVSFMETGFPFSWAYALNSLGVELLGHTVNSTFKFFRNCQTTFQSSFPSYNFSSLSEGPRVSVTSPTLSTICLFDDSHLGGKKWYLMWLWFHSSDG